MNRYKELKFDGKEYTEQYKIDEILIDNDFSWFLDCEVENVRIEIQYETLIFNAGVFFNGTWQFGVFRDGEWKSGTWENGVWYNGIWRRGTFKSGIIYDGRFFSGKIESGVIKGGEFYDIKIDSSVDREDNYEPEIDKDANKVQAVSLGEKINYLKLYEDFIEETFEEDWEEFDSIKLKFKKLPRGTKFKKGDEVLHKKYGKGVVLKILRFWIYVNFDMKLPNSIMGDNEKSHATGDGCEYGHGWYVNPNELYIQNN